MTALKKSMETTMSCLGTFVENFEKLVAVIAPQQPGPVEEEISSENSNGSNHGLGENQKNSKESAEQEIVFFDELKISKLILKSLN